MRQRFTLVFVIRLLLVVTVFVLSAQPALSQQQPLYKPHELIITFAPDITPNAKEQLRHQHGMVSRFVSPFDGAEVVILPD